MTQECPQLCGKFRCQNLYRWHQDQSPRTMLVGRNCPCREAWVCEGEAPEILIIRMVTQWAGELSLACVMPFLNISILSLLPSSGQCDTFITKDFL